MKHPQLKIVLSDMWKQFIIDMVKRTKHIHSNFKNLK